MRRHAIIFCAPKPGKPDDVGVETDIASWKSYLTSEKGGAWYGSEINSTLKNPTQTELEAALSAANHPDYLLIAFAGHGCTYEGEDTPRIAINQTTLYSVSKLRGHAERTLVVLDSCRDVVEFTDQLNEELQIRVSAAFNLRSFQSHRAAFEAAVLETSTGTIMMHSCSDNESAAGKEGKGGAYTQALISVSRGWAARNKGILDSEDAHGYAVSRLQSLNYEQKPDYDGGRRMEHFPFSVSV